MQCLNLHVFIQENSYHIILSSIRTGCLWLPNCLHQIFINICNMYHHLSRTYKNIWQTYLLSYIQPSSSIIDWYKTSLKSEILKMAFPLKIAGKQKCFVFLYFSHTLFTTDKLYEFSIIIVLFLNFSWSLCETLSHYNYDKSIVSPLLLLATTICGYMYIELDLLSPFLTEPWRHYFLYFQLAQLSWSYWSVITPMRYLLKSAVH